MSVRLGFTPKRQLITLTHHYIFNQFKEQKIFFSYFQVNQNRTSGSNPTIQILEDQIQNLQNQVNSLQDRICDLEITRDNSKYPLSEPIEASNARKTIQLPLLSAFVFKSGNRRQIGCN